jgi:nitrous oxide reductase accessory protein NosL
MKKFLPFMVVAVILAVVVGVFLSLGKQKQMIVTFENPNKTPINIVKNKYQDAFCGMVIEDTKYASQAIRDDGKSWFFHDHGDFVEWLKDKPFKDKVIVYVHTIDTNRWIDASKAYYTTTEQTPMGYGFGAYEHKKDGMIDYNTMKLRVLRGETMNDPKYRQTLLKNTHGNS